jgi:hypothetical protein
MQATAKICKVKFDRTMKKVLLVGNGASSHCFAVELNKVFHIEDAQRIIDVVSSGRF